MKTFQLNLFPQLWRTGDDRVRMESTLIRKASSKTNDKNSGMRLLTCFYSACVCFNLADLSNSWNFSSICFHWCLSCAAYQAETEQAKCQAAFHICVNSGHWAELPYEVGCQECREPERFKIKLHWNCDSVVMYLG